MTSPLEDRLASDLLYAMKYGNDDNLMTSAKESLAAYDAAKAAPAEPRPGEPPIGADDTPDWKLTAKFLQDDLINAKAESRMQRERAEVAEARVEEVERYMNAVCEAMDEPSWDNAFDAARAGMMAKKRLADALSDDVVERAAWAFTGCTGGVKAGVRLAIEVALGEVEK